MNTLASTEDATNKGQVKPQIYEEQGLEDLFLNATAILFVTGGVVMLMLMVCMCKVCKKGAVTTQKQPQVYARRETGYYDFGGSSLDDEEKLNA